MALANPLGYDIVDATNAWIGAGKVFATKTDNTVRSEADMATRAGQKWADTVSYALERTRQIFNGTLQVPGPFIVDPAADAVAGDANANADDLIVGNNASATASGITILTTDAGTGRLNFGDATDNDAAAWEYDQPNGNLIGRTGGASRLVLNAIENRPASDNQVSHGTATKRWSDLHTMQGTVYGNLTLDAASPVFLVGDASGSPIVRLTKSAAGGGSFADLFANGTRSWDLNYNGAEDLNFDRYIAGVSQDTAFSIANATGDVTIANDLTLSASAPTLSLGDAVGASKIIQHKTPAGTGWQYQMRTVSGADTTGDKRMRGTAAEVWQFQHYNGSAWESAMAVTDGDTVTMLASASGTLTLTGGLDAATDARARQCIADGDNAGIATTNALTNVADTDVAGAGLAMNNNTGDGLTHTGFIKFYVGTQAVKVPYFV